jgi:hypothetical protein
MKDGARIRIRKVYASCPGWPSGGSKELSSQTQIYAIPCRLQLPTNKWRSAGPGRSLCLLSITGLAALGGQYHSLSGTEFSASMRVTCLLPNQPHRQKVMPGQKSIYETFLGFQLPPLSHSPFGCQLCFLTKYRKILGNTAKNMSLNWERKNSRNEINESGCLEHIL